MSRLNKASWSSAPRNTKDFTADPLGFVNNGEDNVFLARVFHWKICFVSSFDAVNQVLQDKYMSSKGGYEAFKGLGVFGNTVLFEDGNRHSEMKQNLTYLLTETHGGIIDGIISKGIHVWKGEVDMYSVAKKLCNDCVVNLFTEEHEKVKEFQKLIWNGTVSTGVDMQIMGFKSAMAAAKEARNELLQTEFSACPFASSSLEKTDLNAHRLMFSSSMVSKALGSVITSFVREVHFHPDIRTRLDTGNSEYLKRVLQEVLRMYPPVIGCCRSSSKSCLVGGNVIPEDSMLWCCFATANRDPQVYTDPNCFKPDRWLDDQLPLLSFGGLGKHHCVGEPLAMEIIYRTAKALLDTYTWTCSTGSYDIRWLPVSRPKHMKVTFT